MYPSLGAATFASRRAYRLAYRLQRESPRDRALGRAFRLRRKLGSTGAINHPIESPRRMRWKTFDHHMKRVPRGEGPLEGHMAARLSARTEIPPHVTGS